MLGQDPLVSVIYYDDTEVVRVVQHADSMLGIG